MRWVGTLEISCNRFAAFEKLRAEIEGRHRVGHLDNVAYLTGGNYAGTRERESFHDDTQADQYLSRAARPEWKLISRQRAHGRIAENESFS